MRAVIQRVSHAKCRVEGKVTGEINQGLLVFLGIEVEEDVHEIQWLANKIINLRIFGDEDDLMIKSLLDIEGYILFISQYSLLAPTKKGSQPSFIRAEKPANPIPLYERMIQELESLLGKKI